MQKGVNAPYTWVEWLRAGGARHRALVRVLGPDLLDPVPAIDSMLSRARCLAEPAAPLADVLLDQRIATGIGNVFKSEVLFARGLYPARRLADVSDALLEHLYREAACLLAPNVGRGPRVTRTAGDEAGRLWVYARTSQPCLRCGAKIASARLGIHRRSTFWCPRCQPSAAYDLHLSITAGSVNCFTFLNALFHPRFGGGRSIFLIAEPMIRRPT